MRPPKLEHHGPSCNGERHRLESVGINGHRLLGGRDTGPGPGRFIEKRCRAIRAMFCSDSAQLSFVLWVLGYLGCASIVNNAASVVLCPTSRASDPPECGPRCKVLFACYTEDDKLLPICHAAAKNLT